MSSGLLGKLGARYRGQHVPVANDGPRGERWGFFQAMTDVSFKLDAKGRQLFFPWGVLGRGWVIPSNTEHARLVKTLTRLTKVGLIATIVLVVSVRPRSLALLALPPMHVGYYLWVRHTTRAWTPAGEKLPIRESLAAQSRVLGRPLLWSLLLGSLLFVVAGTWLLVVRPDEWFAAATSVLFFGLCSAAYAWMIGLRTNP